MNNTRSCSRKRTAVCLEMEAKEAKANWEEVLGELTGVCHFAWQQKRFSYPYTRKMKFSQRMIEGAKMFNEIRDDGGYAGHAQLDHVIEEKTVREHMEEWQFN